MSRGIVLALAIFVGIAASAGAAALGVQNVFLRAAAFVIAVVLIFGGYSWTRRSASSPPRPNEEL